MTDAYGTSSQARQAVREAAETFEDAADDVRAEAKQAAKRARKSAIAASGALAEAATTFARDAVSMTGNATPMIMSAFAYLIVTLPLTYLVGLLEKKLDPKR